MDDHELTEAELDFLNCVWAGGHCGVEVDRAASIAVLCRLHVSYSLVRGVRDKLVSLIHQVNSVTNIFFAGGEKKAAVRLFLGWLMRSKQHGIPKNSTNDPDIFHHVVEFVSLVRMFFRVIAAQAKPAARSPV